MLTPEQEARLGTFTDPDAQAPIKYSWDDSYQRRLLAMLLSDSYFLIQSLGLIKPNYFTNESHVLICKLLLDYFNRYKALPDSQLLAQEIKDNLREREDSVRLYYLSELEALYDYYVPGLNTREYLLDKVTNFAKVQSVKVAFHNSLEKITKAPEDEKTWASVYDELRQAMLVERNVDIGLEYFTNTEELFRRMSESFDGKGRFTSGFESIDNNLTGGGLFPGQIGAWISLPGTGKSLCCCKAAVENIKLGHKVLYVTLEMSELGIGQRFTSQFMKYDINNLLHNKHKIISNLDEFKSDKIDSNVLIIKQFPGGSLDVNGIRAYMAQLEMRGFIPNLLIVDYVGEMKDDPTVKTYESRYRILRDLRGFGVEKGHCTLTAVQPNISAAKLEIGEYIDESNIGTSFDQFKPLDAFWSINQQIVEKEAQVARGFVIKHRDGKSRFPFKMGFDYKLGTLDVFEISTERYCFAMSEIQTRKSTEVQVDNLPEKKPKKKRFNGGNDDDNGGS